MVLINLDRLYEETLYDFSGCFKQWALNFYLKRRFGDKIEYWNKSFLSSQRIDFQN